MLTLDQVYQLADSSLEIRLITQDPGHKTSGTYDNFRITAFTYIMEDLRELAITLYHECIHAGHDLIDDSYGLDTENNPLYRGAQNDNGYCDDEYEMEVEAEAQETFRESGYLVLEALVDLYDLKIPKRFWK